MYTITVKVTDENGNEPFSLTLPEVPRAELIGPDMATPGASTVIEAITRALSTT
jgi:hypothetical protein